MKDYIAELENKKRRQKLWTTVFVVGFMLALLAVLFSSTIVNEDSLASQAEDIAEEKTVEKTKEIEALTVTIEENKDKISGIDSTIKIKDEALEQLEAVIDEKKQDSIVYFQRIAEENKALKDSLRKTKVEATKILEKVDALTATSVNREKIRQVKTELKQVQMTAQSAVSEARRNNNYGVYIIYMKGFEEKAAKVKANLPSGFVVEKFEQMDKFSYNRSIRYFNENDLRQVNKLQKSLENSLQVQFEIRQLNLPAPDKTVEIWIGQKERQIRSR